jgi:hypothetical protein
MIVELLRTSTGSQGTFGVLVAPEFNCRTIELPWKENRRNVSCIPEGEYDVVWCYSRTFKKNMYLLLSVPGRSGIRIHSGNLAGDKEKGLRTHSYGCILPGKYDGRLGNQKAVLCSRFALSDFERTMGRRPFRLRVKEMYHA